jgi:beta-glucosidase
MIQPGETVKVSFRLTPQDLAFYLQDMSYGCEKGKFTVFIGGNSRETKSVELEMK